MWLGFRYSFLNTLNTLLAWRWNLPGGVGPCSQNLEAYFSVPGSDPEITLVDSSRAKGKTFFVHVSAVSEVPVFIPNGSGKEGSPQ